MTQKKPRDGEKQQLVTMARQLERLLARRRRLVKHLTEIDGEIREIKKLLRDMTEVTISDVYGEYSLEPKDELTSEA